MLNVKEIQDAKFSRSMGGYKQEEVDTFLDRICDDYEKYEDKIIELNGKIDSLTKEIENMKDAQSSIQSVLINAQKLADQIVEEAKTKSEQIVANAQANIEIITAREKELSDAFDRKANVRMAEAKADVQKVIDDANERKNSIDKAAQDSVERQQTLFNKLKFEVAAFKADIMKTYKEHLEVLSKIPDAVPGDPEAMAELVANAIDKLPDVNDFVADKETEDIEEKEEIKGEIKEQTFEKETISSFSQSTDDNSGFTVDLGETEQENDDE